MGENAQSTSLKAKFSKTLTDQMINDTAVMQVAPMRHPGKFTRVNNAADNKITLTNCPTEIAESIHFLGAGILACIDIIADVT
jgi:hypothetical protein